MTARLLLSVAAVLGLLLAAAHVPPPPLPPAVRADRVIVDKSDRTLSLLADGQPFATYRVSLGAEPRGHKQREGDERTPEGEYVLDWRNAESAFFRSLHVSYPDAADRAQAAARGNDPGGMIMVYGLTNGFGWVGRLHRVWNWTDGCIAVTNAEMAQVWDAVPPGTPVEIRP